MLSLAENDSWGLRGLFQLFIVAKPMPEVHVDPGLIWKTVFLALHPVTLLATIAFIIFMVFPSSGAPSTGLDSTTGGDWVDRNTLPGNCPLHNSLEIPSLVCILSRCCFLEEPRSAVINQEAQHSSCWGAHHPTAPRALQNSKTKKKIKKICFTDQFNICNRK